MPEKVNIDKLQVKSDYLSGMKLKDITQKYEISLNTLKSWIKRGKWSEEKRNGKKEGAPKQRKRGAPLNNKNAKGHGAPRGNRNAVKFGFYQKYLPEEAFSIIEEMPTDPLDILWSSIQLSYAAIVRAQQIMFVKNRNDKTIEKIEDKTGSITGERWEVQQAWDKHGEFMKSQARAMAELRSQIRQYDEMLHVNWNIATEEQKMRIEYIRAQTSKIQDSDNGANADIIKTWAENVMKVREEKDGK